MGATISLNGHVLGQATNQFLRYEYPVGADRFLCHSTHCSLFWCLRKLSAVQVTHVLQSENTLTVAFDRNIDCEGRWMACTGGWDWYFAQPIVAISPRFLTFIL